METEGKILEEVKICSSYDEVIASEEFKTFLEKLFSNFIDTMHKSSPERIMEIAGGLGFLDAENELDNAHDLKSYAKIKMNGLFSNIINDEKVNDKDVLDFLFHDEEFITLAGSMFMEIKSIRGDGIRGKFLFMRMFTYQAGDMIKVDFSNFEKYLIRRMHNRTLADFSERARDIIDGTPQQTDFYGTYEEFYRGKRFSIISYKTSKSKERSDLKEFFLYDNEHHSFDNTYILSNLNPEVSNYIGPIDNLSLIKYGLQAVFLNGYSRKVLLDLDSGDELFYFDNNEHLISNRYFPLICQGKAIIYDAKDRKNVFEAVGYEFQYHSTLSEGLIGIKDISTGIIRLFSVKEGRFVFDHYSSIKELYKSDDPASI